MSDDDMFEDLSDLSLPSDCEVFDTLEGEQAVEEHDDQNNPEEKGEVEMLGEGSGVSNVESKPKKRRGLYKKGFLFKRKGSRNRSTGSLSGSDVSEGQKSEGYFEKLNSVFSEDPSDFGVDSNSAISGTETTIQSESAEDADSKGQESSQGRPQESKVGVKKRRRKPNLTVRKMSKKQEANLAKDDDSESEDGECAGKHDIGVSCVELCKYALEKSEFNDENLPMVAQYLKLTLDDFWIVAVSEDTLSLSIQTNIENPIVERAITWKKGKVNFLVCNQQLTQRHAMWRTAEMYAIPENCKEIADYLTGLATRFEYFEVCSGIASHNHLWEKFAESGTVYHTHVLPCFRSSNCGQLLVYPGTCSSCRSLQRKMMEHERQKKRTAARGSVDKTKINIKYLQAEEINQKIKRIQQEKKMSNQAVKRLRRRVDQLIKRNQEKIDNGLSADFVDIMNSNVDKMTQIERIFWEQQSLALSKRGKSKTMRWHPAMIRLALHLRTLSPSAFDFLSGIISLPSARRLFDYSQFADIKEGVQEDLLKLLQKEIEEKCLSESDKYFSFLLDEMSIRSKLVYCSKTGELIGYTDLTSLEAELASLEAEIQGKNFERKLAKKVLVFMLHGCCNDIKFVAAIYSTDDLSASQLYTRVWDVIYAVEEIGAKILLVLFDGASVNRKFIRLHFNMGDKDYTFVTTNSSSGEPRLLFFMLDPPHLLKTFRNCFANSYSHRKTRFLTKDNQKISWEAIEVLFNICAKFKCTKLTQAHVKLNGFSCMKVILAIQVFSNSVADALEKYKNDPALQKVYSDALVAFIRHMNRCFDCLNGGLRSQKRFENPDLLEYTSQEDPRFEYLENDFIGFLEEWEKFAAEVEGSYSKDQRGRMLISYQSLEAMKITIHSFVRVTKFLLAEGAPSVSSRKFNQDPLEQYFSDLRRKRGSDDNPDLKQVLHDRLSLQAAKGMSSLGRTKRGNTEAQGEELVDESPVPVKKKTKRD